MGVHEAYLMLANTNVNSLAPCAPNFVLQVSGLVSKSRAVFCIVLQLICYILKRISYSLRIRASTRGREVRHSPSLGGGVSVL